MSTTMSDNSTTQDEFNPTLWDDFVWRLGGRTHSLGEYVMKLGDRIHGDRPMGLDEAHNQGHAAGLCESLRLSFQSTGRVGGLLTAILKKSNLTTEGLAAKTKIAVGRVRELQDDAEPTRKKCGRSAPRFSALCRTRRTRARLHSIGGGQKSALQPRRVGRC